MRVFQLVPSLTMGDATSNHLLEIDDRLREWGYRSAIFADIAESPLQARVRPLRELRPAITSAQDLLIYHYGMFHYSMHLFQLAPCRRMLIYHNITPASFFRDWDPAHERSCQLGRLVLRRMNDCDLAVGDSDFNRQELVAAGFAEEKTAVLPIFLTPGRIDALPVDAALQQRIRKPDRVNWLTVGRIVPNKAIDELLRLFFVYQKQINPAAHLHMVGSRGLASYNQALNELVSDLSLQDHVTFTGRVSDSQLKTYYLNADLFVSTSYHEGFCVPLLESMYFKVPVLARKAAAIPETLGDAGVLFHDAAYGEIAEMAHLMINNDSLRAKILRSQDLQLKNFEFKRVEEALRSILQRVGA